MKIIKLLAIDEEIYNRCMKDATINITPKLNTHSHDFGSALRHGGGYRHVYYKPGVMLYNLQYVLGDDLLKQCKITSIHGKCVIHIFKIF